MGNVNIVKWWVLQSRKCHPLLITQVSKYAHLDKKNSKIKLCDPKQKFLLKNQVYKLKILLKKVYKKFVQLKAHYIYIEQLRTQGRTTLKPFKAPEINIHVSNAYSSKSTSLAYFLFLINCKGILLRRKQINYKILACSNNMTLQKD